MRSWGQSMKNPKDKKVLVDANIVLDVFLNEFSVVESTEIFENASRLGYKLFITSKNLALINFVLKSRMRKSKYSPEVIRNTWKLCFETIFDVFEILEVTHQDCVRAFALGWEDYEDAMDEAAGLRTKMDILITRDEDFANSNLTVMDPLAFFNEYVA